MSLTLAVALIGCDVSSVEPTPVEEPVAVQSTTTSPPPSSTPTPPSPTAAPNPTPSPVPPTATLTFTPRPSDTLTPTSTTAPTATPTETALPPTATPTETATPTRTPGPTVRVWLATVTPAKITTATPIPAPFPQVTATLPVAAEEISLRNLERQMVEAINLERQERDLPLLQVDENLTRAARAHAQDLIARNYIDHVSPEGRTLTDRLQEWEVVAVEWGENIASSVKPAEEAAEDAVARLMADPPHRDNILNPRYEAIGVGAALSPEGWFIFVMDFARQD